MWPRALFCTFAGAFVGGVAAVQYLVGAHRIGVAELLIAALGLMIFTLPGALMVMSLYERLRGGGRSRAISASIAVAAGPVVGGLVLLLASKDAHWIMFGGVAGLVTSGVCVFARLVLFPATRFEGGGPTFASRPWP